MSKKQSRDEIIKELGDKWTAARAAAFMVIRGDRRFLGMNDLRDPMIDRAAFIACTGEAPGDPALARILTAPNRDANFARMVDDLISLAAGAAREALRKAAA